MELIHAHRVAVNGVIRPDPQSPVRLGRDRIAVDGHEIGALTKVYLAMNKPRGVVTTAADEKGRKTVYDYLDPDLSWVAPVGRLDKASEGLLLLTNDSQWGAQVSAPETHLDKIYHVQIACVADSELIAKITEGITTEGGDRLRAKVARILRGGEKNTWLEIVLDEGKNRHIRRMLAALGIEVLRLVRVAIGPLMLGDLAKGTSRPLSATEKKNLDAGIGKSEPQSARRVTERNSNRRRHGGLTGTGR